jgi:hypothetical protein
MKISHGVVLIISLMVLSLCASSWARQEISLNGDWEIQYSHDGEGIPQGEWVEVKVPSHINQDEEQYAWYKLDFDLPVSMLGKRVFLKFGGVKFVSEIHLNGKIVGGHYGGWEPFEVEITRVFGQKNHLFVKVQDVRGVIDQKMDYSERREGERFIEQAKDSVMAPVGSRPDRFGIWQDVSVESRNDVYIDDIFIKTSVREKSMEVDFTLKNLSDRERKVELDSQVYDGENAQLKVGNTVAVLPPSSSVKIKLEKPWDSPKLWSPESPHLYSLVSRLTEDGDNIDEISSRFGFREFWIDGIYFVLNGTRVKFLATAGHPNYGSTKEDAKKLYRDIRSANCVAMRLHANLWPKSWYEAADEVGMLLIEESALWCFAQQYALSKDKFWENMKDHLSGMIRRDKNHPSVVMYSIENEILHVGGSRVPKTERRLAELGAFVKEVDPTRPIMYDGDADPMGIADVENLHYPHEFPDWNLYPNTCYWVDDVTHVSGWPRREWKWEREKPLYMGEFLWIPARTPDPYTIFLGDEAYPDSRMARAEAKAAAWSMQVEAFRAAEVSGMCPWTLLESGEFPNVQYDAVKRAYEPNAAFIKEYDSRFYSRENVSRTVYLYNDTFHPANLKLIWELNQDGFAVDTGEQEFNLNPAERIKTEIELHMPHVIERTPLKLNLKVENEGETVFQDVISYWAFPGKLLEIPPDSRIAIYTGEFVGEMAIDPGSIKCEVLSELSEIPDGVRVLIISPHALDSMKSDSEIPVVGDESSPGLVLAEFVKNGGTVFVMQQSYYPEGMLPASLTDHSSTITFKRAVDHEILKGIRDEDLRWWRGDQIVSVKDISKPTGGAFKAIIDSGGEAGLSYIPLMEVFSGKGRYILSQLSFTREHDEPIVPILFENIINYTLKPSAERVKAGVTQGELGIKRDIESVGAICDDLTQQLGSKSLSEYGVLILEGDSKEVLENLDEIKKFVNSGGKAILHSLTSESVRRMNMNTLFPEEIKLTRSTSVPVTIIQHDPVISGLTNQDLYWLGEHVGSWHSQTPLSLDILDYAVTKGLPEKEEISRIEAEDMIVDYGNPIIQNTGVYMYAGASVSAEIKFPESAEYTFGVQAGGTPYHGVYPEVTLLVDDVRKASVTLDRADLDIYTMTSQVDSGQHRITLAFTNDKYDPVTEEDRNLMLDKLMYAKSPPTDIRKFLAPAALVEIPYGEGFYLIDQINWHDRAVSQDKASWYLTNMLVNLEVPFTDKAGSVNISGGNMEIPEILGLYNISGEVMHLATNGYVYSDIEFASSKEYVFEVSVKGTQAGGEYPNVRLLIDDKTIGDKMINFPGWEKLTFKAFVNEGLHRVSIAFTNDLWAPPEDRNLDIRGISIR